MKYIGKGIATIAIWGAIAVASFHISGFAVGCMSIVAMIATLSVWGND